VLLSHYRRPIYGRRLALLRSGLPSLPSRTALRTLIFVSLPSLSRINFRIPRRSVMDSASLAGIGCVLAQHSIMWLADPYQRTHSRRIELLATLGPRSLLYRWPDLTAVAHMPCTCNRKRSYGCDQRGFSNRIIVYGKNVTYEL